MMALRWGMRAIGLVSTVILARLLAPEDFGLIAMAMVVVALTDSMATTGVDMAVIREQDKGESLLDAAWTIQIIQGLGVAAVLFVAAPFAADYFNETRVAWVINVLAVGAALQGFRNIGTVAFRKELDFAREFRFIITQKVAVFIITIGLAFWLRDYRAMVIGMFSQNLAEVVLSYLMHPYRPKLATRGMRRLWGFSQWLLISRVGMILNERIGQIIVGRNFGTAPAGLYYIAFELGTLFIVEIVMPVRRAMFPNLSRLQDSESFTGDALTAIGMLMLLCLPAGVGVHIVATPMVELLFGDKWLQAIPTLKWTGLFGAIVGVNLTLDLVMLVRNRANFAARKAWMELVVLLPAMIWVAQSGTIADVALVRLLVSLAFVPVMIHYASRALDCSPALIYTVLWRPLLACGAMWLADYVLYTGLELPAFIDLVVRAGTGAIVYALAIAALSQLRPDEHSPEMVAFGFIRQRVGR